MSVQTFIWFAVGCGVFWCICFIPVLQPYINNILVLLFTVIIKAVKSAENDGRNVKG